MPDFSMTYKELRKNPLKKKQLLEKLSEFKETPAQACIFHAFLALRNNKQTNSMPQFSLEPFSR